MLTNEKKKYKQTKSITRACTVLIGKTLTSFDIVQTVFIRLVRIFFSVNSFILYWKYCYLLKQYY